ncbi:STAS domain-containing protein, partial [Brachyspira pilosicoli]
SIESELDALIESGSINLILEISKVEYLSSSGIRVFINMMRKIKDKNGRLVLASVPDVIKKILKTVDLEDLFEVFDSVDDALATF